MTNLENLLGKIILGYTIDEVIGSGGFGTVYRVSKTNASGHYESALKHIVIPNETQYYDVLNSMGGDPSRADNYFKSVLNDIVGEINILQSLSEKNNNHIVTYYDNEVMTVEEPLRHDIFIRMELVTPLMKYLKDNQFTVGDVIELGIEILSALDLCHSSGIIHRDIKDDNIFVNKERVFKVGDFGVAKLLKDKSRAASMKGTPAFLAPEIFAGKPYDHTVDIYSLGTVLYKLLNYARLPFLPSYPENYEYSDIDKALERRQNGEIPSVPVNAPVKLGEIIVKACSPRENRYNSAKEFSDALSQVMQSLSEEELQKVVMSPTASNASAQRDLSHQETFNNSGSSNSSNSRDFEETFANQQSSQNNREKRTEQQAGNSNQANAIFETFGSSAVNSRSTEEEQPNETNTESEMNLPFETIDRSPPSDRGRSGARHQDRVLLDSDSNQPTVKPDLSWLVYLSPVVIAIIAIIYYMNLLSFLKDIPFVGTIVSKVLISLLLSAAFITSLFFAGKKLQERKPETSSLSELTGKEAYYKVVDISGLLIDIKGILQDSSGIFKQVLKKIKQLEEQLKIEPDFGYGKAPVIQLENDIASILSDMKGLAESLNRRDTGQLQEIERLVAKVNERLRRRREMLKR